MRHGISSGNRCEYSRICGYKNPAQQVLDVLATDPVQFILGRHDVAIQDGNGNNIWQAVIGLLLSSDRIRLIALFSSADDIECHIEGFDIDPLHFRGAKPMALFQGPARPGLPPASEFRH